MPGLATEAETIGELFDRVLPALDRLLADDGWDTALLVLHGAVNRAILSYALTGARMFLGHFEQAPGCLNVLDVDVGDEWVVRAVNVAAEPITDSAYKGVPRRIMRKALTKPMVGFPANPISTASGDASASCFAASAALLASLRTVARPISPSLCWLAAASAGQIASAERLGIHDIRKKYDLNDLAGGDVIVCATGVTDGPLLVGVTFDRDAIETETIVYRSATGTVRRIRAKHRATGKFD